MKQLFDRIVKTAEGVYYGDLRPSRRPAPEWAPYAEGGHYIGVSGVVKEKAEPTALRIITRTYEQGRREDGLWGFIGNTLGNAVLRELTPHREVQVRVPLVNRCLLHPDEPVVALKPSEVDGKALSDYDHGHERPDLGTVSCRGDRLLWDMVGHLDGLIIEPEVCYAVAEHKCRGFVEEETDREATSQGICYLAMVEEMQRLNNGWANLPLASFQDDPTAHSASVYPTLKPVGVVPMVCPRDGPSSITETIRQVRPREVEAWERAKVLDFYRRKAQAIVESIQFYEEALALNAEAIETAVTDGDRAIIRDRLAEHAITCEGGARAWDASPEGILEQANIPLTQHDLALKGDFIEAVFKTVEAKAARDGWKTEVEKHEAVACALLQVAGSKMSPVQRSIDVVDPAGVKLGKATLMGGANGTKSWLKWTPTKVKA